MTKSKLKCFVASAFGKEDVDNFYTKILVKALKECNCTAVRVDRIQHNEDIDDKIFNLIDSCDLCVADLTYARPSVYYEAGYAFGSGKPVIYIVRKDHFKSKPFDDLGNYKIHFDLQMKNIIPWVTPSNSIKSKIKSRIKYVTKPIAKKKQLILNSKIEQESFSHLPQYEQIQMLSKRTKSLLRIRGFNINKGKYGSENPAVFKMFKLKNKRFIDFNFKVIDKVDRKLQNMIHLWFPLITAEQWNSSTEIITLLALVSLKKHSTDSLRNILPNYSRIDSRTFVLKDTTDRATHTTIVKLMDDIKSVHDIEDKVREFVQTKY